jgi:hypothetical protein
LPRSFFCAGQASGLIAISLANLEK